MTPKEGLGYKERGELSGNDTNKISSKGTKKFLGLKQYTYRGIWYYLFTSI